MPHKSITNWKEYNNSLKNRGSLTAWIDIDSIENSWYAKNKNKKGAQFKYNDKAIELILTVGKVFHQRLRQLEGFVESVFYSMKLTLEIPDYTTLSRRSSKLNINLRKKDKENVILIFDSSGAKLYGEGEWKVKKHGKSKNRRWLKMHIGIDKDGEIRVELLTNNDIGDCEGATELIDQEKAKIEAIIGDGGYDVLDVYKKAKERNVKDIRIPPRVTAKILQHGNHSGPPHPRDENLRKIRKSTLKKWKEESGYHVRSLVENAFSRIKTMFTDKMHSRKMNSQKTEFTIICNALNTMTKLGMPKR